MSETLDKSELLHLTTDIVSAHLSAQQMDSAQVPGLIETVYKTLNRLSQDSQATAERPQPAVPIRKSVTEDYIICLEDGKKLKMLKRHLMSAYQMTPEDYRERWGLPADYPMVAPGYARKRSSLAKEIGLGRSNKKKAASTTKRKKA